jgi:hypothetical protein
VDRRSRIVSGILIYTNEMVLLAGCETLRYPDNQISLQYRLIDNLNPVKIYDML